MTPPRITLVTPSFNQSRFLPACMDSVLEQHYPELEYYVLDGASSDGSRDIIEQRAARLAGWRSEKDEGQYAAIAEGLNQGTGEILGWINADDLHFPWTLRLVADLFTRFPEMEWISSLRPVNWNRYGDPVYVGAKPGFSAGFFQKGLYLKRAGQTRTQCIQQESTFWRRSLWEKIGAGFSGDCPLAGDFDLWGRMFQHAKLVGVDAPLAGFRKHGDQRSLLQQEQYLKEAAQSLKRLGGEEEQGFPAWARSRIRGTWWPFRHLPSLGLVQPVVNLRWSEREDAWTKITEWIDLK